MGRRIRPQSPVPTSSSLQSSAESGVSSPSSTMQAPITESLIKSMSQSYDASVQQSLKKLHHYSFVITDPHLMGHPIVYVSDAFLRMSGYLAEEVVGRNPKFLQGPDTERQSIFQIRDSVCEQKPCEVILLNYTKQGWPFQIVLHMAPVFSQTNGQLLHFVGVQTPLYECSLRLQKRTVQSAPTLLGLERGTYKFLGQKGTERTPHSNGPLQTGICTGSQQKKKIKVGSNVLQLVIHELSKSSELKSAEAVCGRLLCENAETGFCSSLILALTRIQQSFVISNPNLPGMPIVYASEKFLLLTGYQKEEVLGRSCRFLQGQDTDASVVQEMQDCIKTEKACTVRAINYRKDGSSFWNLLHMAPIRDHTAKIVYFVGAHWELGSADCCQTSNISPVMQQLAVVGAIKVAVRSLQGHGLRRSLCP